MTNDNSKKTKKEANQEQPIVAINIQYIKDLSFENPHSPLVLAQITTQPQINVTIDIKAAGIEKDRYEVVLMVSAKATAEEKTLYLLELAYAAVVTIQNLPPENLEGVLMIHVPSLLFPFARRIIADITRDGGAPTLALEPIDFTALYMMKKQPQNGKNDA